jgi:hypothetical protein
MAAALDAKRKSIQGKKSALVEAIQYVNQQDEVCRSSVETVQVVHVTLAATVVLGSAKEDQALLAELESIKSKLLMP